MRCGASTESRKGFLFLVFYKTTLRTYLMIQATNKLLSKMVREENISLGFDVTTASLCFIAKIVKLTLVLLHLCIKKQANFVEKIPTK